MADNLPDSRGMPLARAYSSSRNYDWLGANDFLGHFEIHKDKLKRIAEANAPSSDLPLTTKEFHGILGLLSLSLPSTWC